MIFLPPTPRRILTKKWQGVPQIIHFPKSEYIQNLAFFQIFGELMEGKKMVNNCEQLFNMELYIIIIYEYTLPEEKKGIPYFRKSRFLRFLVYWFGNIRNE